MSKAQAQRRAGPFLAAVISPLDSSLLERQTAMARSNTLPAQSPSALSGYDEGVLKHLRRRGTSVSLLVEDDFAVVQAHVTSGAAARMLAPLGRKAVGMFKPLAGNMVLIDAWVPLEKAMQMLAANTQPA
jgi:hypothetical protein